MRISHLPTNPPASRTPAPRPSAPPPAPPPDPQDQADIRATQKQRWRNVEWASLGGQVVGGAMVFAHQGGIGLAIFAASSAATVYAGYKGQGV